MSWFQDTDWDSVCWVSATQPTRMNFDDWWWNVSADSEWFDEESSGVWANPQVIRDLVT